MTGIQKFRMRLMKYSFKILHVPGKELVTADTLSREPLDKQLSANVVKEPVTLYGGLVLARKSKIRLPRAHHAANRKEIMLNQ